ncbi:MAG: type II secretion system protein [Candidatus Gastranaerophilaceae bacterium]
MDFLQKLISKEFYLPLNVYRSLAFTLAEVLIVLGIVGIVAELTISTLVANTQKQIYVTSFKKAYTNWNQALVQMAADAGCIGDLSCFFDSSDLKTMGDKIVAYFRVAKNCDTTKHGCWADINSQYIDGSAPSSGNDSTGLYYSFITADGMAINLYDAYQGCSNASNGLLKKGCMSIVRIDVNGLKKPNVQGRDIFTLTIDNTLGPVLYPYGGTKLNAWQNNLCNYGYNGGTDKSGSSCAGRIIDQGWQMNY